MKPLPSLAYLSSIRAPGFGRKLHVVLGRLPDVVVDLDEVRGAVCVSLEVDLPGVVAAGRDAVELGKCDVG